MLRLPPIRIEAPDTLQDAAQLLSNGNTRLVAGGTDLWPNMKRRHQQADTVVSLMSIPELDVIDNGKTNTRIGATATLADVIRDDEVRRRFPAFAKAVASISSPPLRNMGTIGGNLCVDTRCTYYNQTEEWRRSIDYCLKEEGQICWVATKSPRCWAHTASDSAPILCALDARVTLVSSTGERELPLKDMYVDDGIDYLAKRADEILTELTIPAASDDSQCRSAFWKLRRRGSIDFSTMSVAVAVWTDDSDVVTRATMYLGAVGAAPMPVAEVDAVLVGNKISKDRIAEIAHVAHQIARPMDNTDFTASWRGKMTEQYVTAALREIAGMPPLHMQPRHRLRVI
ncbi:MAG: FAD binding domain-containing protein [Gammaproteobacteria bacterium]|nr:FAD binding domain-containing protein [Gammaproteobacteria bacterium]MDH3429494.1 FAD binding domain-containing protein [Gammaproteobacteria bacterium]